MKFAHLLLALSNNNPEFQLLWSTYKHAKKGIKTIVRGGNTQAVVPTALPQQTQPILNAQDQQEHAVQQQQLSQASGIDAGFVADLMSSINRLATERAALQANCVQRLGQLQQRAMQCTSTGVDDESMTSLLQDCVHFHGACLLVMNWGMLAYTTIVKILKKHRKRTGMLLQAPELRKMLSQPSWSTEEMAALVVEAENLVTQVQQLLIQQQADQDTMPVMIGSPPDHAMPNDGLAHLQPPQQHTQPVQHMQQTQPGVHAPGPAAQNLGSLHAAENVEQTLQGQQAWPSVPASQQPGNGHAGMAELHAAVSQIQIPQQQLQQNQQAVYPNSWQSLEMLSRMASSCWESEGDDDEYESSERDNDWDDEMDPGSEKGGSPPGAVFPLLRLVPVFTNPHGAGRVNLVPASDAQPPLSLTQAGSLQLPQRMPPVSQHHNVSVAGQPVAPGHQQTDACVFPAMSHVQQQQQQYANGVHVMTGFVNDEIEVPQTSACDSCSSPPDMNGEVSSVQQLAIPGRQAIRMPAAANNMQAQQAAGVHRSQMHLPPFPQQGGKYEEEEVCSAPSSGRLTAGLQTKHTAHQSADGLAAMGIANKHGFHTTTPAGVPVSGSHAYVVHHEVPVPNFQRLSAPAGGTQHHTHQGMPRYIVNNRVHQSEQSMCGLHTQLAAAGPAGTAALVAGSATRTLNGEMAGTGADGAQTDPGIVRQMHLALQAWEFLAHNSSTPSTLVRPAGGSDGQVYPQATAQP